MDDDDDDDEIFKSKNVISIRDKEEITVSHINIPRNKMPRQQCYAMQACNHVESLKYVDRHGMSL